MKRALYIKFIVAYVFLAFMQIFVVATLGSQLVEDNQISTRANELYIEANQIAGGRARSFFMKNASLSDLYLNLQVVASGESSDIRIIDTQGNEILNTSKTLKSGDTADTISGFNYAAFGPLYYEVSDFFGQYTENHLNVMVPVTSGVTTRGYAEISVPMTNIYAARDSLLTLGYIVTGANFILSLVILIVFTFSVYLPLGKISEGAREFASGNLDHKIDLKTNDEMGRLSDSLNYMAAELKKNNDYQKKFISNVSHDFRSPLTSIKGFTEAMTDGTIPPENHEKYLKIIASETDRLEKLTKSILTLNSVDTDKAALTLTDFDINILLKHTAAVFEGTCRKKKIRINLVLTGEQLTVNADKEKIEQVIYNLLDNAVKFSNRNSTIKLETTLRHGKCYVSVMDEGCGIAKDDLTRIWDRFYKSDESRGKDRRGTGLGLSIVKEIISAHGQTINVISTENVGTEFIFTLPLGTVPKAAN